MTDNDKALVERPCTCHADDAPSVCQKKYALNECRIEAQAAEIERLKREVMLQMGWKTEAQNEVERLREDLLSIALSGSWDECISIARAALGETE